MYCIPIDVVYEIMTFVDYVTLSSIRYLSHLTWEIYQQRSEELSRKERIRLAILHDIPSLYPGRFYPGDLDYFRHGCGNKMLFFILNKVEKEDVWYLVKRSAPIRNKKTLRIIIDRMGDHWLDMLSTVSNQDDLVHLLLRGFEINTDATAKAIRICLDKNHANKKMLRMWLFASKIKSYLKDETYCCIPG